MNAKTWDLSGNSLYFHLKATNPKHISFKWRHFHTLLTMITRKRSETKFLHRFISQDFCLLSMIICLWYKLPNVSTLRIVEKFNYILLWGKERKHFNCCFSKKFFVSGNKNQICMNNKQSLSIIREVETKRSTCSHRQPPPPTDYPTDKLRISCGQLTQKSFFSLLLQSTTKLILWRRRFSRKT